jgi:site-specific recombinase XerD
VRALIHRYLEHLEGERNVSPETLRAYERDLLRFHRFVAHDFLGTEPEPKDVDALAVRSFLAAMAARGWPSAARDGLSPRSAACSGSPAARAPWRQTRRRE